MNRGSREWEIKLNVLASIARSQRALASLLESAAEVTAGAGVAPAALLEHVRLLDGMQAALLRAATGTSWNPPKRGVPASPWLREELRSCIGRGSGRLPNGRSGQADIILGSEVDENWNFFL